MKVLFVLGFLLVLVSLCKAALQPIRGKTQVGNLKLSPIGFGTWAWGNRFLWDYDKSQDAELKRTFDYATSKGVNWFDTADSYGTGELSGRAEELLGMFESANSANIKSSKKANFLTKLAPYPWRVGKQSMISASVQSRQRLNRDKIDVLQLHWPPSLGWQEEAYIEGFTEILKANCATQLGVSNYGRNGLRKVARYAEKAASKAGLGDKQTIYSNQVQFSLLSRNPLQNGLVEEMEELGIQPIGYSPLGLGLLTDKYKIEKQNLPGGARGLLLKEYLPALSPLLGELRSIAKYRKKTVAQVCLNWSNSKGFLVLVGARSVEQAKENLGATGWALTQAEMETIDIAAARIPANKQLVQNSFQSG